MHACRSRHTHVTDTHVRDAVAAQMQLHQRCVLRERHAEVPTALRRDAIVTQFETGQRGVAREHFADVLAAKVTYTDTDIQVSVRQNE